MAGQLPNRVTQVSRGGDAYNKLRDAARSQQPAAAPGTFVSHTIHGVMHEAEAPIPYAPEVAPEAAPFQVYRSDPEALKFKLTEGWIVTTGDEFQPGNMTAEHTLAEGQVYYCYLDLTTTAATVVFATVRPTWSVNKIYVAKVTTTAPPAEGQPPGATIRQILAENPQIPCA